MEHNAPMKQKTIGVLGGLSNISTSEYYTLLNSKMMERAGDPDIAETLIAGMNFGNIERWLLSNNWQAMEDYFEKNIDRLLAGGADFIICASNTCHKTFDAILKRRPFPHLHIGDATARAIQKRGLKRVSLFGTNHTMLGKFIKNRLEDRYNIQCLIPNEEERSEIDRVIYQELCKGVFTPASRDFYLAVAERMAREQGSQGVILGCTEIGQLIKQSDLPRHPIFDTTEIHCQAIVDFALEGSDQMQKRTAA